ncbi:MULTISPECIES: CBS domain-containing protein [Halorubrum]|uniref:CBS domain-containing protein n=1 Tax=Halorubrum sodomense TaxID=35743 RepID=A0A1I6HXC8_HALSD|nr:MULTISPECIES: CBS domain-containing protein [Halorubrum]TKX70840.1 CBS domain-containing protein [Halorubrum sp. SP9]SFR59132.1 CBS domain-containing protein [Halorubrum sodomense]
MRTDTTVRDVMHREFLGVSESDSLPEAAALLVDEETNCLVVVRGGEPVGRLEARDALDALLDATAVGGGADGAADPADRTVADAMGPPLPAVSPDDSLASVEERLVAEGADRVVAVDEGEAVGVVTDGDVLAAGAPRTGTGTDGFGEETATGEPRPDGTVPSATVADSDAERGAGASIEPEAVAGRDGTASRGGAPDTDGSEAVAGASIGASTQGVCENCGALVPDLVTANGQAVCPNCREI